MIPLVRCEANTLWHRQVKTNSSAGFGIGPNLILLICKFVGYGFALSLPAGILFLVLRVLDLHLDTTILRDTSFYSIFKAKCSSSP